MDQAGTILRHLGTLVGPNQTDAQLLGRFAAQREEAAFAALMGRHGRLVWGVCQRLLHREQDAEDAFQATFLVLAHRAASIRDGTSLASWLYGVARRVALKARRAAARRQQHERQAATDGGVQPPADWPWRELQAQLDEEIARLPEKYRSPFVLCCLEGRSRKEAAAELGWKAGTVCSRVAQARGLLQRRLARRGVTLSATLCASALWARTAAAAVSGTLARHSLTAAVGPESAASSAARTLAAGLLPAMTPARLKLAGLLLSVATFATGVAMFGGRPQGPGEAPAEASPQAEPPREAKGLRVDILGDPLPDGALARIGTVRLRHGSAIAALAFSPDSTRVASGSHDNFVHIWDVKTGRELLGIEDHMFAGSLGLGTIGGLAFAPDGKTLAGARLNRPACLWDSTTGKELRTFGGENHRAAWVVFSPDGKRLAYGGGQDARGNEDADIHLTDPDGGPVSSHIAGHRGRVVRLVFSPDGNLAASSGDDKTLRLWDTTRNWQEIRRLDLDAVAGWLAFSPSGKALAIGSEGAKALRLWEIPSGKELFSVRLQGRDSVRALVFSPDGKALLSGHEDGTIRFFNAASGASGRRFQAHPGAIRSMALSPDGKIIASSGDNHSSGEFAVRLWDVATLKPLVAHEGPQQGIDCMAFSADGNWVAAKSWEGAIHVAETSTGRVRHRIHHFGALAFEPQGKSLWTAGWQKGQLSLWDLATGKESRRLPLRKEWARRMVISSNGKTLIASGWEDMALIDLASGRVVHDFGGKMDAILRLALTLDGRTLVCAHTDGKQGKLRLWDTASGRPLRELASTGPHQPGALAVSPDGQLLAWSDGEKNIHLCELASGKELRLLEGEGLRADPLDALAFSPDGKSLLWGGQHQSELFLFEVATGRLRRKFIGHHGHLTGVAFSHDGARMASGSADATVLIWDPSGRAARGPTKPLSDSRVAELWADLGGDNVAAAYTAMGELAASPRQASAVCRKHILPVPTFDSERLPRLLRDLDSDTFAAREAARQGLEKLSEAAEPALRKVLEGTPSPEARRQVTALLEGLSDRESLRRSRALEMLEWAGSKEAVEVLQALATGAPGARRTREAQAALERLTHQSKK
jgi:RNA polymerase sigma factor (sigma-70 family)